MEDLFEKILKAFQELGLWEDGVELIGSWSFLLYQRHFGVRPLPLRTQDIDFLLPWPYPKRESVDLSSRLRALGFQSETAHSGAMCFLHPDLKIEFLVPERGKGGLYSRPVKALGISAVPLRFLDLLLEDSIIVKEGGIRVRIPNPTVFCLQKLIIAQRRKGKGGKREKDIEQAIYVLAILKPVEFRKALEDNPKKWRLLIEKSLRDAWDLFPLERPTLERFGFTPHA